MRSPLVRLPFWTRLTAPRPPWPGFGDQARPEIDWTPQAFSAFLDWFLSEIVPPPPHYEPQPDMPAWHDEPAQTQEVPVPQIPPPPLPSLTPVLPALPPIGTVGLP